MYPCLSPSASLIKEWLTMTWFPPRKWSHLQKPQLMWARRLKRLKHRSVPSCLHVHAWSKRVSWYHSDADSDVCNDVSVGTGRDRKETEVRSCQGVRTDVLHSHYSMFAFWNPSNSSLSKGVSSHCNFCMSWYLSPPFFFFFFFFLGGWGSHASYEIKANAIVPKTK